MRCPSLSYATLAYRIDNNVRCGSAHRIRRDNDGGGGGVMLLEDSTRDFLRTLNLQMPANAKLTLSPESPLVGSTKITKEVNVAVFIDAIKRCGWKLTHVMFNSRQNMEIYTFERR
jgi:hypothetical protein